MTAINGFSDGDAVYLAWVRLDSEHGTSAVRIHAEVIEAEVFSAEYGLVRVGGQPPRQRFFSEATFRSAEAAWAYCGARLALAAGQLQTAAAECRAKADGGVASPAEVA